MSVVIVAVDGTKACDRAAVAAAGMFPECEIVVTTVVARAGPAGSSPPSDRTAVWAATHQIATDVARGVVRRACEAVGSRARPVVLDGEPVTELCALAEREQAAALVVGSVGGHALDMLRGPSVGAELIDAAPCAVVDLGHHVPSHRE